MKLGASFRFRSIRDCALSITDSTTAEGWMRKLNFNEVGEDNVQSTVRADAASHHAQ